MASALKKKGLPNQAFAAALREHREAKGLTRQSLALSAGCGLQAIAQIESGVRSPSLDLAARLARAVGLRAKLADFAAETFPQEITK
jgi:transcriptional regulator with XRE-family HTH domain